MNDKVLEILFKNVDIKGLAEDTLSSLIKPALDDIVKDTKTKIDDTVLELLYSRLAPEIVKYIVKAIGEMK